MFKLYCVRSRPVLPVIEYASSVWFPHYAADIRKVERVQRKFTKRLLGCSKLSYANRLARLKLESLEVRRLRHDLILTYKILFGLTDMNQSDFFTFADRTHSTRGHAYKLLPSHNLSSRCAQVFLCWKSTKTLKIIYLLNCTISVACLFSSVLFLVLICLSLLHVSF